MPYQTSWHYPRRIIRNVYYGVVTPEDLHAQAEESQRLLRQCVAPVHVLLDISGVSRLNVTLPELRELANAYPTTEDTGWVIIVGQNVVVRFLAGLAVQ